MLKAVDELFQVAPEDDEVSLAVQEAAKEELLLALKEMTDISANKYLTYESLFEVEDCNISHYADFLSLRYYCCCW